MWARSRRSRAPSTAPATELSTGLAPPPARQQSLKAEQLRRGVPVSALFAGLGRVIRTRADALTTAEQKRLFGVSRSVAGFEIFISHVCSSPGWKKYITLVLDQLGLAVFVASLMAASGLLVFERYFRQLPQVAYWSFWGYFGGVAAALVVCVFGHVLCRRTCCFFDCASICQHDPDLKAAGIQHIPAFLRASREVVVLWDERYLTRLWCVYEIAVAQSSGVPIRILPLGMYTFLAGVPMLILFLINCAWLLEGWKSFWPSSPWGQFVLHSALLLTPQYAVQAYFGRTLADRLAKLQEAFDSFDVRSTAVSVESDRRAIFDSIEELFDGSLDNFNQYVRTTLKAATTDSFIGQKAMLPYRAMLWQELWYILYWFSVVTHVNFPKRSRLGQGLLCFHGVTAVLCGKPLLNAASMELRRRVASSTRPAGAWAVFADLGVAFLATAMSRTWECFGLCLPDSMVTGGNGLWLRITAVKDWHRELGAQEWHAVPVAVLANGLAWVAAVWAFRPVRRESLTGPGFGTAKDASPSWAWSSSSRGSSSSGP